jgi:hypothetical protein
MKLRTIGIGMLSWLLCVAAVNAQLAPCRDAAEESHHRVVLERARMRVLLLELPRIASTEPYCYASPYVYIVLGEGRSSTTGEGKGTFSHDWNGSESRLVNNPQKQVVRNESGTTFREVIIELRRGLEYRSLEDAYDTDVFPGGLGSVKPTWTVSFQRGGVQFTNTQLAAGDTLKLSGTPKLLIALNDLDLQQRSRGAFEPVSLSAQEVGNLNGSGDLVNSGRTAARFILIY